VKRAALLAVAAISYIAAAWMVAPGFYDGFLPPAPYNWTCPPPQAGANNKPSSGHLDVKVTAGASEPDSVFTDDGQVVMGFLPGAFDVTGKTSISVDITPLDTCPTPAGILLVTNVYKISATAPLVKDSNLVIRYSNLMQDPSTVYFATDPSGPWKSIPVAQQSQPYTLDTSTKDFGYYAAGLPRGSSSSTPATAGTTQLLPVVVAALVIVVVLAGLPLALIRRRRGAGAESDEDADEEEEDDPTRI